MDEKIDLAQITDIKELKALAYDRVALVEQTRSELDLLNARITELVNVPSTNGKAATPIEVS